MKPSEEYTIKVLSPEDYDRLPYNGAHDSLGMSVMDTKTAYIRSTGVKDMDIGTINHEFDELMQGMSPHEVDGIRYKKFTDFIRTLMPVLLGPLAGPADSLFFGAGDKRRAQQQQQQQSSALSNLFKPSATSQAFAPTSSTPQPLGQTDFQSTMDKLQQNAGLKQKSVMDKFRGRTLEGDTAFNRAFTGAQTSSDLERNQFLEDQKKLGSTFA